MTAIAYYRWSLLLPILVPILAIPSAQSSVSGDFVADLLVACLMYGGVAYSLWAIYAFRRLRGKSENEAHDLLLVAPCQVTPLTWVSTGMIGVYESFQNESASFSELRNGFIDYALYGFFIGTTATVLLGYLWVVYVNETLRLLKRWRWVWSVPGETAS